VTRFSQPPRDPAFYRDPQPLYRGLLGQPGPCFWEDYGFHVFARHAEVSALLRDKRFGRQVLHLTTREKLGWPERPNHLVDFDALERHSLLELEPPDHTRLRGHINRAFVSRAIDRLAPDIEALAARLIDGFAKRGEAELLEAFATPLAVGVIAALIGAPAEAEPRLLDWSHKMVAMYRLAPTRAEEDAAAAASREFAHFVRGLIAARRRAPQSDLISQLNESERLSDDERVSSVVLLLNAGHEATVHSLGLAVKTMLDHGVGEAPDEAGVEELLRFESPLHLFTRFALEDVEIRGVRFQQGDRIGLLLGAANRDPAAFADPDRLDLTRAPNPHVAFGAGIHFCVGAPLARREMKIGLAALFRRLPGLALGEAPRWRDAYHFHGLETLRVRF
jgi:unspecific monooxygenase